MDTDIVILAGGLGSRFFSSQPKIIANFWGAKVIDILCFYSLKVSSNVFVVLRKDFDEKLVEDVQIVQQQDLYGTGAAAQSYYLQSSKRNHVLILPGDAPLIDDLVMQKMIDLKDEADIILGVMEMPEGREYYGRVFLNGNQVEKIVEYKFHNEKTEYANTGIILLSPNVIHLLNSLEQKTAGEIYLTEIVEIAIKNGFSVKTCILSQEDALGFNTVSELNTLLDIAQKKWRKRALNSEATISGIDSVFFSFDTIIEKGAVIEPFVKILPKVIIKSTAVIKSFSSLSNCCVSGEVGPFANIRSGIIEKQAEIGSFVEFNRSHIQEGSKAKHLAYLGDVNIGKNVNIGAGCVVCNYDGKHKHKTEIQDDAFIGSNTTLIAPITIEKDALLAAGSTFTENIPKGKLAIARSRQELKTKKNKNT